MILPSGSTRYYEWIYSTQDIAKLNPSGIFWTANQTKGRGRFDRVWVCPPGEALAATFCFDAYKSHKQPYLVGMAAAIAVATAFDTQLQWPNDCVIDGKKVAGILTEIIDEVPVVGVGLNLSVREFPEDISSRATSLLLQGRETLAPEGALEKIVHALSTLPEPNSWESIRDLWMERDVTKGKTFRLANGTLGTAKGITPQGELLWTDYESDQIVQVAEALWG